MQLSAGTFLSIINAIPPASQAASTVNSSGFSRDWYDQAAISLMLGVLGASATVDVKIQECDTLGGTYVDVAGAVFSQKTQAGTNMSGFPFYGSLDLRGRKKFLRVVSVVGTAASILSVQVILYDPKRTEATIQAQKASEDRSTVAVDFTV